MTLTVCRVVAWLIVMASVIDPVIALTLPTRPRVALVTDQRLPDPSLVDRTERALRSRFTVVRGVSSNPAAVVSIGYQLPGVGARGIARAFAVVPEPRLPFAAIASVQAADQPLLQSRLPITLVVRTMAARGKSLVVTLRRHGAALDRVTREISGDDTAERIELQFTPSAAGEVSLTVEAQIGDGPAAATTVTRVVRNERWAVLFFDRRPAWTSTFVRRAIETDPRFVVTSRSATSRTGPAITAGQPPASLAATPALDAFDAIVVGAPEELTDDDVTGLTKLMRERGIGVVLLLDEQDPSKQSAAFQRLTGVKSWAFTERANPFGTPSASAVLTPSPLPRWAEPLEHSTADAPVAAVWRTPFGRGAVVVSGALDAWRYRDTRDDVFGVYWRRVIADAAQRPSSTVADVASQPGVEPDERALLRSWTAARGGRVLGESALGELPAALAAAVPPVSERRPARPMQSPWWMVPFGIALGIEWWTRRRTGLR